MYMVLVTSTVDFSLFQGASEHSQPQGTGLLINFPQDGAFLKEQRLLGINNHILKVVPPSYLLSILRLAHTIIMHTHKDSDI